MPLPYNANLKALARQLRKNATDSENILWSRVRHKQLLGVQFYRQKPIGEYIVDFYAPKAKLVVEVDGSQHLDPIEAEKDRRRDQFLGSLGLKVVRFSSREVLEKTEAVLEDIFGIMHDLVQEEIPLGPPFSKGEA
jgi:very-short-patch-repair endonuclease